MYGFSPVAEGDVTITETTAPGDSRFGTLRFTPASTDDNTLLSGDGTNPILLDTTLDEQVHDPPLPLEEYNADVTVVHVYNFVGAGDMPNSAVSTELTGATLPWMLVAVGAILTLAGGTLAFRRTMR